MSNEINTRNDIKRIFSTFPDGNNNETLTKSELLSGSGNLMIVSGGDTECVPLDAITFKNYVCKSSWDKAPQGSEHYKVRVEGGNIFYIYFTNEVGTITLDKLSVADTGGIQIPFIPPTISKGQTSDNFILVTHEGNRLKCEWISGVIAETAKDSFATFTFSWEGGSYGVILDAEDLGVTYNWIFEVSPTTLNFPASGGSQPLTVNSKKEIYRNGVLERTENENYNFDIVGEGFSMNQNRVVARENTASSSRTGYVRVIQWASNKEIRVNFTQAAASITTNYNIFCSPNYLNWSKNEVINRDIKVTSEKVTLQGSSVISREDVPFTYELTGRDAIKFSAWTLDSKTIRVSPRGLNTNNQSYEAILVLNQTGTSERYSANLIQLA